MYPFLGLWLETAESATEQQHWAIRAPDEMIHDLNRENAKSPAKSELWGFFEPRISCEIHITFLTGTHFKSKMILALIYAGSFVLETYPCI